MLATWMALAFQEPGPEPWLLLPTCKSGAFPAPNSVSDLCLEVPTSKQALMAHLVHMPVSFARCLVFCRVLLEHGLPVLGAAQPLGMLRFRL